MHPPKPPKPPIPLPSFYMLSHLKEDGPVRLDGVKLGICEVMGLELDEPRLGSFAGSPERPGLPRPASCQATPAGAGPPEGCPKGNPARRPAAEDRTKPRSP